MLGCGTFYILFKFGPVLGVSASVWRSHGNGHVSFYDDWSRWYPSSDDWRSHGNRRSSSFNDGWHDYRIPSCTSSEGNGVCFFLLIFLSFSSPTLPLPVEGIILLPPIDLFRGYLQKMTLICRQVMGLGSCLKPVKALLLILLRPK